MKIFSRIANWFILLAFPLLLILTSIRILFSPLFLQIEYRMPGFPPDAYGFNLEDRLYWSRVTMDYLNNNEKIDFLASKFLPDGAPLYNDRELSHMDDVQRLLQVSMNGWLLLLVIYLGIGFLAWKTHWMPDFWLSISKGSWLTISLILLVLVAVVLSFSELFTAFHKVFFSGDSWIFLYSDTLIRLFPLRLWQDGFIATGAITILFALIFGFSGKKLSR